MLVLTRELDQSIEIRLEDGRVITVTVVDFRGGSDRVRLGIEAPKTIEVHRKEVADAIRRENRLAAQLVDALPGAGVATVGGVPAPRRPPCRNVPVIGATGRP